MGRPRKNALKELDEKTKEAKDETAQEELAKVKNDRDDEELKACHASMELAVLDFNKKLDELESALKEKDKEIERLKKEKKSALSKETLSEIKEMLAADVFRSNNVSWRIKGKSLLSELDKVIHG